MLWGAEGLKEGSREQGVKGSRLLFFIPTTLTVVILDFITKRLIEMYVHPFETIRVLPFLQIVNIKNPGAAFGMLSSLSNNIFIIVAFIAIFFIINYLLKTQGKLERISLSLVLGGAIGNLIDRVKMGKVVDFIDFFVGNYHWPAFNVADSALTVGIILFLLANVRHQKLKVKN